MLTSRQTAAGMRACHQRAGAAVETFGFDMPKTIHLTVVADPRARVRPFNAGFHANRIS